MNIEDLAKNLKDKVGNEKEIVEEEEELSIKSSRTLGSKFKKAKKLKKQLLKRYNNTEIEKATDCSLFENEHGEFFYKREDIDSTLSCPKCDKKEFLTDLKLVHGIGPSRERKLKKRGFQTIEDLTRHDKWRSRAEETLKKLNDEELNQGFDLISKWKSSSNPMALKYSGFYKKEDFAILDIETMGLTAQPVILIGLGLPKKEETEFHQILLKDIDQELAALKSFYQKIKDKRAVLTFNGKSFDIPFLERRFNYYGENKSLEHAHFDLYHFSKRVWSNRLPNYKLSTIEREVIGIERKTDIPSSLVPEFYKTYREEKNPGPLIPILEHNRQDILSLSSILEELKEEMADG